MPLARWEMNPQLTGFQHGSLTYTVPEKGGTAFTPEQFSYFSWLALPTELRDPPTEADIATELGVKPTTLLNWQNLPGVPQFMWMCMLHRTALVDLADIIQAQVIKAKQGNAVAFKLVLETLGLRASEAVQVNLFNVRTAPSDARHLIERINLVEDDNQDFSNPQAYVESLERQLEEARSRYSHLLPAPAN
jgi:hypothetical protein